MSIPEEREFAFMDSCISSDLVTKDELVDSNPVATQLDGLPFSKIKGYRLKDFDTHCSIDSERSCPAKVQLVSDYTRDITKRSFREALGADDRSQEDIRRIVTTKIKEYSFWALRADYDTVGTLQCPTRELMDSSEVRKTGVNIFRSLKMAITRVRAK